MVGPNPMTGILTSKGKFGPTDREGHVTTEAEETERMERCVCESRNTKCHRHPPEAKRKAWDRFFLGTSRRNQTGVLSKGTLRRP